MQRLNVAFVGEVDHGKSTLLGRLLYETGSLSARMEAEVASGAVQLAHLTDQLGREQDEGLTVTSAHAFLRHEAREIALIDAPGHEEFIRHMISGASSCEAAVLMIDALEGVRDETRRHALLVTLLRIPQAIAVINKLDAVDDAAGVYETIAADVRQLAEELQLQLVAVVPAAAQTGMNVTRGDVPWWSGPTVLNGLLSFTPSVRAEGPLRFSVQDVYEFTDAPIVAGRVERGTLVAGDTVTALPGTGSVRIEELRCFPDRPLQTLSPGHVGSLRVDRPEEVRRGMVFTAPDDRPSVVRQVRGRVFCLGNAALREGDGLTLRCGAQEVPVRISAVRERLDTGRLTPRPDDGALEPLDLAVLELAADCDVVIEDPNLSPSLGRFSLEHRARPVAFGMVLES